MAVFWTVTGVVGLLLAAGLVGWHVSRWRKTRRAKHVLRLAREVFRRRREWLEADFVTRASERSKPRDLVWVGCEFEDAVSYARDRGTGHLRALVGVSISFAADDASDSEGSAAVVAVRCGTAVFRFENGQWTSDGRAVFNLSPAETIRRFEHELDVFE